MKLYTTLLVATFLTLVTCLDDSFQPPAGHLLCGNWNQTVSPTVKTIASQVHQKFLKLPDHREWNETVVVQANLNVVTTPDGWGKVSTDNIIKQVQAINTAFAPIGFRFDIRTATRWNNSQWGINKNTQYMQSSSRKGGYDTLNLWYISDMGIPSVGGACTGPSENGNSLDGCIIAAWLLPQAGGSVPNYSKGFATVHEIGHWLGLMHVWGHDESPTCDRDTDNVADTPVQLTPSWVCDKPKDSCPNQPGLDSVHNYMDYVNDDCANNLKKPNS
ncbi:hypothetical protein BT63DRAFT_441307 [Microthyrium microscopicum]|uniref:Peptidase M43 pregnancy-associated plasma-A domain-containing protein n=1 Tax=Microthyrium microscopicum TaxID=703497 RepID=A0A6A6U8U8_9PEZI|nr:hypothetical protein BT63DRAFT_441307 [Microthyrium microscopicum]